MGFLTEFLKNELSLILEEEIVVYRDSSVVQITKGGVKNIPSILKLPGFNFLHSITENNDDLVRIKGDLAYLLNYGNVQDIIICFISEQGKTHFFHIYIKNEFGEYEEIRIHGISLLTSIELREEIYRLKIPSGNLFLAINSVGNPN